MVATHQVREIFADALEMLALGNIRNTAENAWSTTKRATDGLVLARTGEESELTEEPAQRLLLLMEPH